MKGALVKWEQDSYLSNLSEEKFIKSPQATVKWYKMMDQRRSEIHVWVANKLSNLGEWENVALFPSSDFIAKNELSREGYQSVTAVIIPTLTTILDRQFQEDSAQCPVCALRNYFDRTQGLIQ